MYCKFGSETVDEGDSGTRLQGISSRVKDIVVGVVAGSTTSSSEEQQDQPHRRRRSSRITHIDGGGSKEGSSFAGDQPEDQGHCRRRNRGQIIHVDTEDQEDLHRQRNGSEVFYIHKYQVVTFLVIPISSQCNLGFQSGLAQSGYVWIHKKSSPGGLQVRVGDRGQRRFGRSSTEDQPQDRGHHRRRSSRIKDIG